MNKAFIEKIVADDIRDGIILGEAILAGTPEKELFSYCAGHATLTKDTPMTLDTVIDGASTTKVVTIVTALLILHKRGLIDFDAPFTNYLPQYEAKLD
ncbi:MAG: serine hydrolase, partial [Victivallales bacterium]|nr:serine hydrolase [Victivallales bacterium]